jgi:formylglycine-generating enzyme required for sulfatase activity
MSEEESKLFTELPKSFHNLHEYDAEYILIPGGRYKYQGKTEKEVPNVYFAKYPVTNKRHRRFIGYLEEKERELLEILPNGEFDKWMTEFASGIKGFGKYLGDKPNSWPEKLRPDYDSRKRFNGEDQPVVRVSWFDAIAYCYWLSLLEAVGQNLSFDKAAGLYRLPSEIEWEWAAGGGEREYPWASEKGLPSEKLASYGWNVKATTPVGRYPDGATPEGLMDMAGNVEEWMENFYDKDEDTRSLRGGSWSGLADYLRCSYRDGGDPDGRHYSVGFRVVRSQS